MELPSINLKVIIMFHWFLAIWATLVHEMSPSYGWSNFTALALGVWAVANPESVDAITMFLAGLVLSMASDPVSLGLTYHVYSQAPAVRFSCGVAILSLIVKPVSIYFVYCMYRERGGQIEVTIRGLSPPTRRADYEPIADSDAPHLLGGSPPPPPAASGPPHQFALPHHFAPPTTLAPSPQY